MLDRHAEGDAAAQRIAHDVDLVVAERLDDISHVVAHRLQGERPVAERGAAMTLQVDGDDGAVLGKLGQDRREHVRGAKTAMQQKQRLALAVDGVIVVQAVDRQQAGLFRLRQCVRCGRHGRFCLLCIGGARAAKQALRPRQEWRKTGFWTYRSPPSDIKACDIKASGEFFELVGALAPALVETHFLVLLAVGDTPVPDPRDVAGLAVAFVLEGQDAGHEWLFRRLPGLRCRRR